MGMGGPVGLDYLALELAARTLGVQLDRLMLEKIQELERRQLDRWAVQMKTDRERSRDGR